MSKTPRLRTLSPRVPLLADRIRPMPKPSQMPGYRTRGRRLQRIREAHLRANPLCVACLAMTPQRIAPGTEVDHIRALADGGSDTPENRQSLCGPCHALKSAREAAERGPSV